MNPIVSYEDDNPYRWPSLDEALAFWGYLYKKSPLSLILYFLSVVLFFAVFWLLARGLLGSWIGDSLMLMIILALVFIPMLFFSLPRLPRSYEAQFKGKLRPDIPKDELRRLLMDMTGKSLELGAMVIMAMCALCTLVYLAAKYLLVSDVVTLILVIAVAFNAFVILLVAVSLGGYNKDFLRKTFTEEEYRRFTSLKGYKRAFTTLVAFDALAFLALAYATMSGLTVWQAIILLAAIAVNAALALSLWKYRELKNKSESERKATLPQIKILLAILGIADLVFIAAFAVQKFSPGTAYELILYVLFSVFILALAIAGIAMLALAAIRRARKTGE